MVLLTTIFVFNILTILQENHAEEISGRPDMTFSCKQNRNSKRNCFVCHFVNPDRGFEKENSTE